MNVLLIRSVQMRNVSTHAHKPNVEKGQSAWLNNIVQIVSVRQEPRETH